MQKQTLIQILLAVAALAFVAGLLTYYSSKPAALVPVSQTPALQQTANSGPTTQPQIPLPFNGQEPSLRGKITSVDGDILTLEVPTQPLNGQGVQITIKRVQLSASTVIEGAGERPTRSDLSIDTQIVVYAASAEALDVDPIAAQRIEIVSL